MNNLRDIVRRHVEEETLRDFLEGNYSSTSDEEKHRLLEILRRRGEIDREVNAILDTFLDEIEKNSPKKKRRKTKNSIYAVLNLACTILIAYAVNTVNWPFVWGLFGVNALIHLMFYIWGDE